MKQKQMIAVGLLAVFLAVGAGVLYAGKTAGHYASHAVEKLADFHTLNVQGPVEVDFIQDAAVTAHVSGPQKWLDKAIVRVKDGTLEIALAPGGILPPKESLKVMVTAPALRKVNAAGASEVRVRGKLQGTNLSLMLAGQAEFSADDVAVDTLRVQASGHSEADINRLDAQTVKATAAERADIELAGLALKADFENNGSGEIDATDLRVQQGKVTARGKGDIKVSAYETLDAAALGKGKIKYKGHPVELNRSGALKHIVLDMDD